MSCITEILKLKGDQEALVPEGNWIAVEGGGKYKDYEYLVVLNDNGHRCGYVAIPPDHPASQIPLEKREFCGREYDHYDYNELDIECHGGLTFMSPTHSLKELLTVPCNDMWVGFDCGHCYDSCDQEAMRKYFGDDLMETKKTFIECMDMLDHHQMVKDFEYVEGECHSIIDQLITKAA